MKLLGLANWSNNCKGGIENLFVVLVVVGALETL